MPWHSRSSLQTPHTFSSHNCSVPCVLPMLHSCLQKISRRRNPDFTGDVVGEYRAKKEHVEFAFISASLSLFQFGQRKYDFRNCYPRLPPFFYCAFFYFPQFFLNYSHSPIPLANLSIINLVSIFRCSSSKPVYARRVNCLVLICSLS